MSFENLLLYTKAVAVNYDTEDEDEERVWIPELDANNPNSRFDEGVVRR